MYEVLAKWANIDLEKRKDGFSKLFSNLRLQHVPLAYLANRIRKDASILFVGNFYVIMKITTVVNQYLLVLQKLVREFHDCRDLVEDAFFFHAKPEMVLAEKPRKSYEPSELNYYFSSTKLS